jgi:hypothetical protein
VISWFQAFAFFQIQLVPLTPRAERESKPLNHEEEMLKRMAKIRERTGELAHTNFTIALRERNQQDAKIKKQSAVRAMRADIKLMVGRCTLNQVDP